MNAKLEALKSDLRKLDDMSAASPGLVQARLNVAAIEAEIDKLTVKLHEASRAADSLELADAGRMQAATSYALELSEKYGMALPDMRALVEHLS